MNDKLKILVIAPYNLPIPPFEGYGGTQRVIFDVVERLAESDDITLFAPENSYVSKSINLATYETTDREQNERLIVNHLDGNSYDLIYTHLDTESLVEKLALFKSHLIVAAHYYFGAEKLRRFSRIPCYLQTQSRAQATYFSQYAPNVIDVTQSVSIENITPSLNFLSKVSADQITLPELIELKERNADYLLILSRISDYKGQKTAIEIARRSKLPLVIAGEPIYEHEGDFSYFNEYVAPQIDAQNIIYFGNASEQQKYELMRFAKGSVLPTGFENPNWHEAFGRVVNESLACGTPVIAANRGAMPEQIVSGECGYLFETIDEAVAAVNRIDEISRANCIKRTREFLNAGRFVSDLRDAFLKLANHEETSPADSSK